MSKSKENLFADIRPLKRQISELQHQVNTVTPSGDMRGKQFEEALIKSESNFSNLVEGSIQGVCIISAEPELLFNNKAFAYMLVYSSPKEMQALGTTKLLDAPHERQRLSEFRKARLRRENFLIEYDYVALRKDGPIHRLQATCRQITWLWMTSDLIHKAPNDDSFAMSMTVQGMTPDTPSTLRRSRTPWGERQEFHSKRAYDAPFCGIWRTSLCGGKFSLKLFQSRGGGLGKYSE